jgi:hypothetical protein
MITITYGPRIATDPPNRRPDHACRSFVSPLALQTGMLQKAQ